MHEHRLHNHLKMHVVCIDNYLLMGVLQTTSRNCSLHSKGPKKSLGSGRVTGHHMILAC